MGQQTNGPPGAQVKTRPGDRPLTVATQTAAGTYTSLFGLVERAGVGPQPDLVDHHRRHRDGVPAAAGPFGCQLLAGFGDLGELEGEEPTVFVDARQQQLVDCGFCRFGGNLPRGQTVGTTSVRNPAVPRRARLRLSPMCCPPRGCPSRGGLGERRSDRSCQPGARLPPSSPPAARGRLHGCARRQSAPLLPSRRHPAPTS
jgi:hypothetical protein